MILGLENDLSTLKGADLDAFELHLRNVINNEFGLEYAASHINIRFHQILDQSICTVDVSRGTRPLFVRQADKSGAKTERFFIRSGNSSPPMNNPSEIASYIAERF